MRSGGFFSSLSHKFYRSPCVFTLYTCRVVQLAVRRLYWMYIFFKKRETRWLTNCVYAWDVFNAVIWTIDSRVQRGKFSIARKLGGARVLLVFSFFSSWTDSVLKTFQRHRFHSVINVLLIRCFITNKPHELYKQRIAIMAHYYYKWHNVT